FAEALDGEPDAHRDDAPPRLAALRRRLFARADDGDDDVGGNSDRAPGRDRDVGEADDSVHAVTAPGEGRECVEIVRQLRDAARAGMPFDRMAVLLRDPAGYLPPLEAALRRAGVPAYVNRGSRRPDPSGRALLALLACAAEDLATVHFADYLSLGQVPALRADGTLPAVEIAWVEPSGDQLVFKTPLGLPDSADAAADDAADRAATPAPFVAADRLDAPDDATADGTPAADDAADAASARAYDGDAANGADGADVADDAIRGSAEVRAGASATPRRWQRLLIDAAVVGGRDRWRQRLEGLEGERTLQLRDALLRAGGATRDASPAADAEATADDADARDDGDIRRLRAELVALRQLRRFALPVIDQLAALPTAAPWGDWLDALERLAVSTLRQPAAALRVLADLRPMRAIGPIALDAVRRTLAPRLAWLQTPPTARRHGRVFVGHVDDARGRGDFDLVCLPGLAEGIFPRRPLEDPLLLDALRRALDPQLPTQARRVDDERLRLRLAVGAAGDRLVISVPRLDALQGQARVPSFYALDLLRAADGRLPALGAGDGGGDDAHALPAPRDASDALDPAEFDLATLAPALHANDAATVTGRGRYLLAAAPALARSLRRRARRWRARFTAADGLDLGARDAWSAGRPDVADALRAALDARRPRHHAHAATALEAFAACPYRFYLRAIVGLRPRPVPSAPTHLDPRTRGALFHEVQAALLQALDDDDAPPLAADRDGAIARADALLDRIAARWRDDLLPRLPQVWQREIEDLRLDLRGWIHDRADDDGPWQPLEVEFDLGDAAVVADGMRVRGAADLIEVHARDGTIRAVDHKTGPAGDPGPLVVGGGEVLQPLLYALAASGRLGQPAVEGALYHCTRRGGYRRRAVPIDDRTVGQLQRVLDLIDHHVAQGFLPAAPRPATRQRPDACAGCDFRSVCGPHEPHRVTIKARQPLQALTNVRRLG
ncbi:MAG: PD-(D/E)XK nuclease family protein, partial [Acidobacteriota bacterium]